MHRSSACENCGAPKGETVVHRILEVEIWCLDTDLYEEFPETWGKPEKVAIGYTGICKACELFYMGPKDGLPQGHLYYGLTGGTLVVGRGPAPTPREERF